MGLVERFIGAAVSAGRFGRSTKGPSALQVHGCNLWISLDLSPEFCEQPEARKEAVLFL